MYCFFYQYPLLFFASRRITADPAIRPDDAMTRDYSRKRIFCQGLPNSTVSQGLAHTTGNPLVRTSLTIRNCGSNLQNLPTKRRVITQYFVYIYLFQLSPIVSKRVKSCQGIFLKIFKNLLFFITYTVEDKGGLILKTVRVSLPFIQEQGIPFINHEFRPHRLPEVVRGTVSIDTVFT